MQNFFDNLFSAEGTANSEPVGPCNALDNNFKIFMTIAANGLVFWAGTALYNRSDKLGTVTYVKRSDEAADEEYHKFYGVKRASIYSGTWSSDVKGGTGKSRDLDEMNKVLDDVIKELDDVKKATRDSSRKLNKLFDDVKKEYDRVNKALDDVNKLTTYSSTNSNSTDAKKRYI